MDVPAPLEALTSFGDPRLIEAMRIYGEAFPPHEQMSTAFWLELIRSLPHRNRRLYSIVSARETVGMIYLELHAPVAVLWYLCTRRDLRGRGVGAEAYRALTDALFRSGTEAMVFEVERPAEAARYGTVAEDLARRRIAWYQRQGAQRLLGVDYEQTVDNGSPATPMDLMIHVPGSVSAEAAYRWACLGLKEKIPIVGTLGLQ